MGANGARFPAAPAAVRGRRAHLARQETQRVRRTIEGIVSAIADRPFSIEGEFDYDLGRIVTVRSGKIRWRNSASNASPYMLEVEQFTGSFDLLSLFDWPLVITRLQARHATLLA